MKRRTYIPLGLTIVALAALFFLKHPTRMVETSYSPPDWQLPIDTSRVERIEVRRAEGSFSMERKHGTWRLEQAGRPKADSLTVTRLLEGIANFKLIGLVSSNPRKADLFGVGESGTTIVVTSDDAKPLSLVVGKMSSLSSRAYIRPTELDMVYLVRGMTPDVFTGETGQGSGDVVFKVEPGSILSMSVSNAQSMFTIRREGQRWFSLENPVAYDVIAPALAALAELRADESIDWEPDRTRIPLLRVVVQGQQSVTLEFYGHGTKDGSNILRTSLAQKAHVISKEIALVFQHLMNELSRQQPVVASRTFEEPLPAPPVSTPKQTTTPRVIPASRPEITARRVQPSQPQTVVPSTTSEVTNEKGKLEDEGVLTVHIVKGGETLWTIARQYNVTEEQVRQWNLLTTDVVSPGTELYVFARK